MSGNNFPPEIRWSARPENRVQIVAWLGEVPNHALWHPFWVHELFHAFSRGFANSTPGYYL